jgi:ribonuclease BN (tRNA processing enzyme)
MFFTPLFDPECEVRIWGPAALDGSLLNRLARYISAPLAPVEIRELPANVSFEDARAAPWALGPARVEATLVNHRGPTLGYRITDGDATIAYIPDHEPALGQQLDRSHPDWVSGHGLARDADLLIHDAQYTDAEYAERVGWGHSALTDTLTFAHQSGARHLALFHHEPVHDDTFLDEFGDEARTRAAGQFEDVVAVRERDVVELPT